MNLVIHGNTLFAWTAAAQMAAQGHSVLLCPAWSVLITVPDDEVLREPGLREAALAQQSAGRLRLGKGVDVLLAAPDTASDAAPDTAPVHQHWLAQDAGPRRLQDHCEALLVAACQQASAASAMALPAFAVLTPYPIGTLVSLNTHLQAVFAYQCQQAKADQRPVPSRAPVLYHFPLFVRGGFALHDFMNPSLLLLGCDESDAEAFLLEGLRPILRRAQETLWVSLAAAEVIKSGVNAMLATRVSFMNELAELCEVLQVDVEDVRQGLAADPRIGSAYLEPGCGFGGPSFADEVIDFSRTLEQSLDRPSLLGTVMSINQRQRELLFRKVWRYFQGDLAGRCFAVWGASYKPGSSSVQGSAVHPLLQALWAQGASTVVYDPMAGANLAAQYTDQPLLTLASSQTESLRGCRGQGVDGLLLVTAWDEFSAPDYALLKRALRTPVIFDGRNVYDPEFMQSQGFTYVGIGRGEIV